MEKDKTTPQPITAGEIDSVAKKLHEFAKNLPPKERALVNLLIARSDNPAPSDAVEFVPDLPMTQSVQHALRPLIAGRGTLASAWVEAGDPWVQSGGGGGGWVEAGDPWVQSGTRKLEQVINVQSQASQLGRFFNPKTVRGK